MAIVVSGRGDYTPAPVGMHNAVCCDVIDHGMVESMYGLQHKVSLVFLLAENMENGKPFSVSRKYTASLNNKATLYKDLVSWRGKAFEPKELDAFDLEDLISIPCFINVVHETREDRTYANIASISPIPKGMERMRVPGEYVRKKDRTDEPQAQVKRPQQQAQAPVPIPELDDNEPPF